MNCFEYSKVTVNLKIFKSYLTGIIKSEVILSYLISFIPRFQSEKPKHVQLQYLPFAYCLV